MTTLLQVRLVTDADIFRIRRKIYLAFVRLMQDSNHASLISSSFSTAARALLCETDSIVFVIESERLDSQAAINLKFIVHDTNFKTTEFNHYFDGYRLEIFDSVLNITKPIFSPRETLESEAFFDLTKILLDKTTEELLDELNVQNKLLEKEVEDRKKAEENLKETQVDLINNEKLAALGSMVAGVAHEINTPVGTSVTAASHIKDSLEAFYLLYEQNKIKKSDLDDLIKTVRESNAVVEENLRRAANLIRSFKEVAVDQTAEDDREIFFKQYVDQVITSLSPKFRNRSIETVTDGIDPTLKVVTTPGPIAQIISNLIENSLIHGFDEKQSGTITLSASATEEELLLIYSDNGKGISPENLQKIFDPFFTTKRSQGGTGLGMHLVHNLVRKKFSGHIKCESTLGAGVTFFVTLRFSS